MDKETLSNYGWIVICVMVMSVMLALATPFGSYIAGAVGNTTQGLFDTNQKALESANIEIMQQEFELMLNGNQNEGGLHFGEPYCLIDEEYLFIYVFHEDGSLDLSLEYNGESVYSESMPAGTVGYDGANLTDSSSGETVVVGTVLDDGKKIDMGNGDIFVLNAHLCAHANTEVRDITSNYTGNTYCLDCGAKIFSGTCLHGNTEIRNTTDTYTGDTYCKDCNTKVASGEKIRVVIPTGGVYYTGVFTSIDGDFTGYTAKYVAGEYFPETVSVGDVYVYGDYEYRYAQYYYVDHWTTYPDGVNAKIWGMRVLDTTKQSYGTILQFINGAQVKCLEGAFRNCKSLTDEGMPIIPEGVTNMLSAFANCTSLVDLSDFVIPESVTAMNSTFYNCTNLRVAPRLHENVKNVAWMFANCTALTGTIVIDGNPSVNVGCFDGVNFATQNITLAGKSTILDELGATGINYCAECNGKCNGGH